MRHRGGIKKVRLRAQEHKKSGNGCTEVSVERTLSPIRNPKPASEAIFFTIYTGCPVLLLLLVVKTRRPPVTGLSWRVRTYFIKKVVVTPSFFFSPSITQKHDRMSSRTRSTDCTY